MVLEFLNAISHCGYRIFSISDAVKVMKSIGLDTSSLPYLLRTLVTKKVIRHLFRGNYAIEEHLLAGHPLHKFEIAMHLSPNGAICCWSAMEHYMLTDQVLSKVYILAPYQTGKPRSLYNYKIDGYNFVLIQTEQQKLWGTERIFAGERKISITDLERTLIDCVAKPQYCGGFREALNAFSIAKERLNLDKLIDYTKVAPPVIKKRICWILDHLNIDFKLEIHGMSYYDKLDPSAPRRGKYNKKWMLLENF